MHTPPAAESRTGSAVEVGIQAVEEGTRVVEVGTQVVEEDMQVAAEVGMQVAAEEGTQVVVEDTRVVEEDILVLVVVADILVLVVVADTPVLVVAAEGSLLAEVVGQLVPLALVQGGLEDTQDSELVGRHPSEKRERVYYIKKGGETHQLQELYIFHVIFHVMQHSTPFMQVFRHIHSIGGYV